MTQPNTIKDATEHAADLMMAKPTSQWGQWVQYLLEVLDSRAQALGDKEEYHAMLDSLHDAITYRMATGRW